MNDADEILYHLAFRTEVLVVDDNDLCPVLSQMALEPVKAAMTPRALTNSRKNDTWFFKSSRCFAVDTLAYRITFF